MIFEIFENYLKDRISVTSEELVLIKSLAKEQRIKKSHFILQAGELTKDLIFVATGMLTLDRADQHGNRRILKFAAENSWLSEREIPSFYHQPSDYISQGTAIYSSLLSWCSKRNPEPHP